jgi:hypothetical protein
MIHELKTKPEFFNDVACGDKTFEVRLADREFRTGDYLALNEFIMDDPGYTGRCMVVRINYILADDRYCKEGHIILGIIPCGIYEQPMWDMQTHKKMVGVPVYDRDEQREMKHE